MNNPKWEGKIFMRDEKTCYKDGFNDGVESCQFKIMQLKAQIEKMKNCKNCEHYETTKDYGVCRDKCAKNKKGQWILTNWKLYKD